MQRKLLAGLLAVSSALLGSSAQAITIQLDFSLDTTGYFTPAMRQELGLVSSLFERNLTNHFGALNNLTSNLGDLHISKLSLPADTLRIYVGAADLPDSALGQAYVGTAVQAYTRGFGGYMLFDTTGEQYYAPPLADYTGSLLSKPGPRDWYVDSDITTIEQAPPQIITIGNSSWTIHNAIDFYSVAIHEMGHVFGLNHAYEYQMSTAYGRPQTVAMGAVMTPPREYFTEADWLAMRAIGWQVTSLSPDLISAVPEPATYGMLLAGLGLIGAAKRRRAGGAWRCNRAVDA